MAIPDADFGILAHVNASRTPLTELILFETGVISPVSYGDVVAAAGRSPRVFGGVALLVSVVDGILPLRRRPTRAIWSDGLTLLIFFITIDRLGAGGETRSFPCTVFRH